jgi:FkbM family methyltransferase
VSDRAAVPEPALCPAVRVPTDVGDLWYPANDQVMLPHLRATRSWEPSEGQLLASLLRPDSRFLDVGANVGYFSVFAARICPRGTIDSVEPDARALSLLRLNLWTHAPHAKVWPLALGRARGAVALQIDDANYGDTRVQAGEESAVQLAAMMSADEAFAGRAFDVIKIDVQGFEDEVVLGMQHLLRGASRLSIVAEFFPLAIEDRGLRPRDVLATYRSLGLDRVVSLGGRLERLDDEGVLSLCRNAGKNGFVNLLLRK